MFLEDVFKGWASMNAVRMCADCTSRIGSHFWGLANKCRMDATCSHMLRWSRWICIYIYISSIRSWISWRDSFTCNFSIQLNWVRNLHNRLWSEVVCDSKVIFSFHALPTTAFIDAGNPLTILKRNMFCRYFAVLSWCCWKPQLGR